MLSVTGLTKSFPSAGGEVTALHDVSFSASDGLPAASQAWAAMFIVTRVRGSLGPSTRRVPSSCSPRRFMASACLPCTV